MSDKPLTKLDFQSPDEVSVVDRAANKRKFPIWKSKETSMDPEILKAVIEQELGDEKAFDEWVTKAGLSDKGAVAAKAMLRIASGFKEEFPADFMSKLAGLAGMDGPPAPVDKEKPDFLKDKEKEMEEEPVKKALEGLPEDVRKALDEKDAARDLEIKSLTEANEKVIKALEVEKDARNLAIWVQKTETDLSHYPGESSEEIAKSLHEMGKIDPTLAEKQFTSMKAASDALKGSEIFKNAGNRKGAVAAGSAWEELEELAGGIVAKSTTSMSGAQAMTLVLKTEKGAELYAKYESEQEGA